MQKILFEIKYQSKDNLISVPMQKKNYGQKFFQKDFIAV